MNFATQKFEELMKRANSIKQEVEEIKYKNNSAIQKVEELSNKLTNLPKNKNNCRCSNRTCCWRYWHRP